MSQLILGTNYVLPDEDCWSLKELNLQAPNFKGFRRFRIITVFRGGKFYEKREDMGRAGKFKADQFAVPGGVWEENGKPDIVETVGRLVEVAERIHAGYMEPVERPESTDLVAKYKELPDRKRRERKRQSTFGYGGAIQRS